MKNTINIKKLLNYYAHLGKDICFLEKNELLEIVHMFIEANLDTKFIQDTKEISVHTRLTHQGFRTNDCLEASASESFPNK